MKKYDGGTESLVSGSADLCVLFAWLSLIGGIAGLFIGFANDSFQTGWVLLVSGLSSGFGFVIVSRLLRGSAEQIRLLKRLNGLPYAGQIKPVTYFDPEARKHVTVEAEQAS